MKKRQLKFKFPKIKINFEDIGLPYLLSGLVLLVTVILGGWFGFNWWQGRPSSEINLVNIEKQNSTEIGCKFRRVLDGVCVETEEQVNPRLVAVMIENHPDSRPQSGLYQASVVYEAPVEGNYSRFLAIFPSGVEVKKAGPVRSVRPYYLDWVREYGDPLYMHVGGSPEALVKIDNFNINDLGTSSSSNCRNSLRLLELSTNNSSPLSKSPSDDNLLISASLLSNNCCCNLLQTNIMCN